MEENVIPPGPLLVLRNWATTKELFSPKPRKGLTLKLNLSAGLVARGSEYQWKRGCGTIGLLTLKQQATRDPSVASYPCVQNTLIKCKLRCWNRHSPSIRQQRTKTVLSGPITLDLFCLHAGIIVLSRPLARPVGVSLSYVPSERLTPACATVSNFSNWGEEKVEKEVTRGETAGYGCKGKDRVK